MDLFKKIFGISHYPAIFDGYHIDYDHPKYQHSVGIFHIQHISFTKNLIYLSLKVYYTAPNVKNFSGNLRRWKWVT